MRAGTDEAERVCCWVGRDGAGAGRAGAAERPPPRFLCQRAISSVGKRRKVLAWFVMVWQGEKHYVG